MKSIFALLSLLVCVCASPASAAEQACATAIFCEDAETLTLPGRWIDGAQPTITVTANTAQVFSGSKAIQANLPGADGGWLGTFFTPTGNAAPSGTPGYDHIYARMYAKLSANWVCVGPSCGKFMVFYGAQSGISGPYNPYSGNGKAGVIPNGSDYYYAGVAMVAPSVPREIALYEYYPEQLDHSGFSGDAIVGSPTVQIPVDRWTCIEQELLANTPGQHDGLQRVWVNDTLVVQHAGMRWRDTLNLQTLQFQLSFSLTPPQTQQYWVDNVVVSTQRIGCSTATAPGVPTGVTVTKLMDRIWQWLAPAAAWGAR
jgi:hypothetical protein